MESKQLYLGREPGTLNDVMLDANALMTHGVILGMTGSGKTGMVIDLVEEALLADIPVIMVDPKGDLGNLALVWTDPYDVPTVAPWLPGEACDKAAVLDEVASGIIQARADWNLNKKVKRLSKIPVTIYTPGSTAGTPINTLSVLSELKGDGDSELLRENVASAVTALLALTGITADPLRSPEHVLVATLIERELEAGHKIDLVRLISMISHPPDDMKLGVFTLDEHIKPRDRANLALALNNMIASPSFKLWGAGQPLSVDQLFSQRGASVFYLAHLDEPCRQFFITLLLGQICSWMRRQPGTDKLRALLLIDEAYGIAPPISNPPTKKLLMTLIKQARAFGLGVMVATQNPTDLDYKALATGVWLVGRLQTEQDRRHIVSTISSTAGCDEAELEAMIARLKKRQFLLRAVGRPLQVIDARNTVSYLRGPMTRQDLKRLCKEYVDEAGSISGPINNAVEILGLETQLREVMDRIKTLSQVDGSDYFQYKVTEPEPGVNVAYLPEPRLEVLMAMAEGFDILCEIRALTERKA